MACVGKSIEQVDFVLNKGISFCKSCNLLFYHPAIKFVPPCDKNVL